MRQHSAWTDGASWKLRFDNLSLLLQPFNCACLLPPLLRLHPLPHLTAGLADLCALTATFRSLYPIRQKWDLVPWLTPVSCHQLTLVHLAVAENQPLRSTFVRCPALLRSPYSP